MRMYIKKLHISNFRNIQHSTVDFDKEFNFIIGLNGNGKSTVLKAINFLFELKQIPKETRTEYIYKQQDNLTAHVFIDMEITPEEAILFQENFPNIEFHNKIHIERKLSFFEDELKINGAKTSLINLETFLLNNGLISPLFYFEQGSVMTSLLEMNNTERYLLLKKACSVSGVEDEIKKNIKILNHSRSAFAENSEFLIALELKIRKYRKMKIYKEEYDNLELERNDIEMKLKGIELNKLENILKTEYENNEVMEIKKHLHQLEIELSEYNFVDTKEIGYKKQEIEELNKEVERKEEVSKNIRKEIEEAENIINDLQKKLYELIIERRAVMVFKSLKSIETEDEYELLSKELRGLKKTYKEAVGTKNKGSYKESVDARNRSSMGFTNLIDKRKLLWGNIKDLKYEIKKEEHDLRRFKLRNKILDKKDLKIDFKYVFEIINVPSELEIAVSSVLGCLLFAVVIKTEEETHKLIQTTKNINIICLERIDKEKINKERRSLIKHEELIRMSGLIKSPGYEYLIEMLFKEYFLVSDINSGLMILNKIENNEIQKNDLRNTTLKNLKMVTLSGEKIKHTFMQTNFGNYNKFIYAPKELNKKIENIKRIGETLKENKQEIENLTKRINISVHSVLKENTASQNTNERDETLLRIHIIENQIKQFKKEFINENFQNINLIENEIQERKSQIEILKIDLENTNLFINENEKFLKNLLNIYAQVEKKLDLESKINEIRNKGFSNKIDILKQQTILEKNKIQQKIQTIKSELGNLKIQSEEKEGDLVAKKEGILKKLLKYKIDGKENFNENLKKIDAFEIEKGKEIFENYEKFYKKNEELKQTSHDLKHFIQKLIKHKEKVFFTFLKNFEKNFKQILDYLPFNVSFVIENTEAEEIKEVEKTLIYRPSNGEFNIQEKDKSGGQKSLITLLFMVALQITQPSSLYLLDEVDASIDKSNRELFIDILSKAFRRKLIKTQFFIITFNSDMLMGGRILNVNNGFLKEITKEEGVDLLK